MKTKAMTLAAMVALAMLPATAAANDFPQEVQDLLNKAPVCPGAVVWELETVTAQVKIWYVYRGGVQANGENPDQYYVSWNLETNGITAGADFFVFGLGLPDHGPLGAWATKSGCRSIHGSWQRDAQEGNLGGEIFIVGYAYGWAGSGTCGFELRVDLTLKQVLFVIPAGQEIKVGLTLSCSATIYADGELLADYEGIFHPGTNSYVDAGVLIEPE
jgi:opacity protein-like surface antigen